MEHAEMCTVGRWELEDDAVDRKCCQGWKMAQKRGRAAYLVVDANGGLHVMLQVHRPAVEVLAVIGMNAGGEAEVVWMEEFLK